VLGTPGVVLRLQLQSAFGIGAALFAPLACSRSSSFNKALFNLSRMSSNVARSQINWVAESKPRTCRFEEYRSRQE
jgi:hypothetical protein